MFTKLKNDFPEHKALIDLKALRMNVINIRKIIFPAELMAVVKADAYGHGLFHVAHSAIQAGAKWLGVAHISEALFLRSQGIPMEIPMLAWLHTRTSNFKQAIKKNIDLGVSSWELDKICKVVHKENLPCVRVHLKIDTGLGRNGSTIDQWVNFVKKAIFYEKKNIIKVIGIFSHLSKANQPKDKENFVQFRLFNHAISIAKKMGFKNILRHLANTSALLSNKDTHLDLVRSGIGIYGLSPFKNKDLCANLKLKPIMSLKTTLAQCKIVPAGQGISYDLTYRTSKMSLIGLIPIGYADGIPKNTLKGYVSINCKRYAIVGRIAMDQMIVDLGEYEKTNNIEQIIDDFLNSEVIIFGNKNNENQPDVNVWAEKSNTTNYDIITKIGPRVDRIYINKK